MLQQSGQGREGEQLAGEGRWEIRQGGPDQGVPGDPVTQGGCQGKGVEQRHPVLRCGGGADGRRHQQGVGAQGPVLAQGGGPQS